MHEILPNPQCEIIQGRRDGADLAPFEAVTVAPRRALVEQHPQPDGWRNRA